MNTGNRKNKNHDITKLLLFNQFAKQIYKKKIKWIVIGGLNDFPNKIGRDMDIIIKDKKKIKVMQNTFINCLKKFNIKNIIFKNDFYGNLTIAFDKQLLEFNDQLINRFPDDNKELKVFKNGIRLFINAFMDIDVVLVLIGKPTTSTVCDSGPDEYLIS